MSYNVVLSRRRYPPRIEAIAGRVGRRDGRMSETTFQQLLWAEFTAFTGLPCLEVERILRESDAGLERVLDYVNRENALLHDVIIPRIQGALFEYEEEKRLLKT